MANQGSGRGSSRHEPSWNFSYQSGLSPDGSWTYNWAAGSGPGGSTFSFGSGAGWRPDGATVGFGFGWGGSSSGGYGFYGGSSGFGFGGGSGGFNFHHNFGGAQVEDPSIGCSVYVFTAFSFLDLSFGYLQIKVEESDHGLFRCQRVQCLRIGNAEIPNDKRLRFALQHIQGIGRQRAHQILNDLSIGNKFAKDLTGLELHSLRDEVSKYLIGED
ncbi:hypothetical protein GH714_024244 [Hevea brasiliensis]|uniref:Uncharacterized protein n=1 Tax=Hevea brasiliensis TaxID=3981 RepID=A0A6A6KTE5_HEVBR|nr:hypothetical protein GH714_024244 [Hevea brasiliensis]